MECAKELGCDVVSPSLVTLFLHGVLILLSAFFYYKQRMKEDMRDIDVRLSSYNDVVYGATANDVLLQLLGSNNTQHDDNSKLLAVSYVKEKRTVKFKDGDPLEKRYVIQSKSFIELVFNVSSHIITSLLDDEDDLILEIMQSVFTVQSENLLRNPTYPEGVETRRKRKEREGVNELKQAAQGIRDSITATKIKDNTLHISIPNDGKIPDMQSVGIKLTNAVAGYMQNDVAYDIQEKVGFREIGSYNIDGRQSRVYTYTNNNDEEWLGDNSFYVLENEGNFEIWGRKVSAEKPGSLPGFADATILPSYAESALFIRDVNRWIPLKIDGANVTNSDDLTGKTIESDGTVHA